MNQLSNCTKSGFDVDWVDLSNRESFEGWRVRATLKMLSTVYETEAQTGHVSLKFPNKL